jgi:hypothetical protein
MKTIRKMMKVRRLVIVMGIFKSWFGLIAELCNPSRANGMGNPFFPVRVVPVDTMPNANGYVLMILMERVGLLCLPKSPGLPEGEPAIRVIEKGPDSHRAADIEKSYKKVAKKTRLEQGDARLTIISRREERELLQQREEKNSFGASRRHRFAGHECLAGRNFKRPHSDDEANAMEEYDKLKAEEQRRWIEEERIRQMGNEESMIQIEEETQRRWRENDEQRRWRESDEQRKLAEEEQHRKWVEEKEHLRQMEEREFRRQMEEKEFRRQIEEKEFRRQIEEKEIRRQIEEKEFRRQVEEKELKRQVEEQREREVVRRTGLNLRNSNDMVQDLIADSLREVGIPHLSEDTAQKLKQIIAEAVKSIGTADQRERRSVVSTSTVFGGIRPENITVSQFGRPDKETPEPRLFEEGFSHRIAEVDNPYERRYDACGGAVERSERYEDKLMPQSGSFVEGYSQSIVEVNTLYQHGYNAYESAVGRESYQHDQKPQHNVYSMGEVPVGQIGVDGAGTQPLKLRVPSGVCSNSVLHLEGGEETYTRNVYQSDVNPIQRQEQSLDSYTRHSHFTGDSARNERQPLQDWKPSLHSAVAQGTDSYATLIGQNRSLANAATSYVPLSNARKHTICSAPKPPGTEDVNRQAGSSYFYGDSVPQAADISYWQVDNGMSYLALEAKDSSQGYRNRMHDGHVQDRTHHSHYYM